MSGSSPEPEAVTASTGTEAPGAIPLNCRYAIARSGTVAGSQTYWPLAVFSYFWPETAARAPDEKAPASAAPR